MRRYFNLLIKLGAIEIGEETGNKKNLWKLSWKEVAKPGRKHKLRTERERRLQKYVHDYNKLPLLVDNSKFRARDGTRLSTRTVCCHLRKMEYEAT